MNTPRSSIVFLMLLPAYLASSPGSSIAQTNAIRARVAQAVDIRDLVSLRGNVHPLARREFDQGLAPDDLPMQRMLLVLQRGSEQEDALRRLLEEQQVKSSPQFHQWLTPEMFGQQFGPNDSDLHAVTDWLASQGFQVTKIASGRTVIEFSGTAGLVRQVLGAEIHKFRVNEADHWANVSDPRIPAALVPVVAGFASLNNFPRRPLSTKLGTFRRSKATGKVQPLFTYPTPCVSGSGTWCFFALGPTDFATIYNITPLWAGGTDGTGQTIAVVGETNINIQDVRDFRTMFGLPANDPNIILNGPDPGINGDETEADVDVQWSGAVAKGATIDLVVSQSTETTNGVDLSALYIIDNNLAPVMSESYGACEAFLGAGGNQFYNTLWQQAAAEGITVVMASGDSGSAGCDSASFEGAAQHGLAVSGLASTPYNVAVGGTDFNDLSNPTSYWNTTNLSPGQNSAKSYIPEMPWNDSCASSGLLTGCTPPPNPALLNNGLDLVAGGGGPSSCVSPTGTAPDISCSQGGYAKPSWQSGPGVPADGARDIPDVSLFAGGGLNPSFYVMCQRDANTTLNSCDLNAPYSDFQGQGGTSASAQVFAGVMALVTQVHGRQGNANYVFYPLAAQAGNTCTSNAASVSNTSCIFHDINPVAGQNVNVGNSVICYGGTANCSNSNSASGQFGVVESGSSAAFPTTAGYDLATGLGTVNVANLVNKWKSDFTTTAATLLLSATPPATLTTLTHGQSVNFSIGVTSGRGTPTGDASLILQSNANPSVSSTAGIGPFTLSSGSATGSTNMLPGGSYNVAAHYAGDGKYGASDSAGVHVNVAQEGSQTEFHVVTYDFWTHAPSYDATTVAYGWPYVLRMDVTNSSGLSCAPTSATGQQLLPAYPCPTGTVAVDFVATDQSPPPGTTPGSFELNSQGYAEDQRIQLSPATYSVVASYGGDQSYTPSNSPTLPMTITKAITTTDLTVALSSVLAGSPVNFVVDTGAFSNGAAPTGTFQFFLNGSTPFNALGRYSSFTLADGAYIQEFASAVLPPGSNTLTAVYPGDNNYTSSTSPAVSINVTDFSVSANPSPVTISAPGHTGASTITVTPLHGLTGTVDLSVASGCPTNATCTFSPWSVTVGSTSAVTSTLAISTTGSAGAPPALQRRVPPSFRLPVKLLGFPAWILTLILLFSSPAIRRRPAALLFAIMLLIAGVWVACGGGGGSLTPPPPAPTVNLSPTSLSFTSQKMGTTSAAQSVTLTNTGTATLSIAGFSMAGTCTGDFSQTNACGSSVSAGANCSISVKFAPTATGSRSASVSIADNASGSPHAIGLTGTGAQQETPPGTYSIVMNATLGGLTHSLTLNVTVE